DNAGPAADCRRGLGLDVSTERLTEPSLPGEIARADVTVNTVPEPGVPHLPGLIAGARRLLDGRPAPGPPAAGAAAQDAGVPVIGGAGTRLNQAFGQGELFTGLPAPRDELAAARAEALGRH